MAGSTDVRPRPGRTRLLRCAADQFAHVTFGDLSQFLGPTRVAERAGESPGTITHHFPKADGLARAGLSHALGESGSLSLTTMAATLHQAESATRHEGVTLEAMADALSAQLEQYSSLDGTGVGTVESEVVASLLASAVAVRDPSIATLLRESHQTRLSQIQKVAERLLEVTQRHLIPQMTSRLFAASVHSMAWGFTFTRRFDSETYLVSAYTDATIRLFVACSTPRRASQPSSDSTSAFVAEARTMGDYFASRQLVVDEAVRSYLRAPAWEDFSITRLGQRMNRTESTIDDLVGGRLELACAVRGEVRLRPLLGLPAPAGARGAPAEWRRALQRLAEAARMDPALTRDALEHLIAHELRHGTRTTDDGLDPRNVCDLSAALGPLIARHARSFCPGYAQDDTQTASTATHLAEQTLRSSLTMPHSSVDAVAEHVMHVHLRGMLLRRPRVSTRVQQQRLGLVVTGRS